MTENPGRLRTLLDGTLTDEPPLLDLVHGAVAGAEHRRRRGRLAGGAAATAVLALGVGAYSLVPAKSSDGSAGSGPTSRPTAVQELTTHGFGLPGLFDNPGTPQEQCAKGGLTKDPLSRVKTVDVAHAYCVRVLTQLRALFSDDVIVLQPTIDFGQPRWSAKLVTTPDGGVVPGFTDAYQTAAKDPEKVVYTYENFAFTGPHGTGTISYLTGTPGGTLKPGSGGDMPLSDGTTAHLTKGAADGVILNGVDRDGHFYELAITGVWPIYAASGSTLQPDVHGDGADHELFPDGTVSVVKPGGKLAIPNPYTLAEVKDLLKGKDLAAILHAIGPDVFADPAV